MDYEQLLDKAQKEIPEKTTTYDRFKIDKVKGHVEGNKTVTINLKQIAKQLNRELDHFLKFLFRELATPGKIFGERVIFGTKLSASLINKKIKKYLSEFVICSECGKPDTEIVEIERISYLKCLACGTKKPVKSFK